MWTEIWCNFVNNSGTIGTFVPLAGFTITIVTIFKIKRLQILPKMLPRRQLGNFLILISIKNYQHQLR